MYSVPGIGFLMNWLFCCLHDCLQHVAMALWLRALEKATTCNASRRAAGARRTCSPALSVAATASSSAAGEAGKLLQLAQNTQGQGTVLPEASPLLDCLPKEGISRLNAECGGGDVVTLLMQQVEALRVETQRKSLASVAGGLRT